MSYKIKSRIWIEHNDSVLLGEGRVKLLKKIDNTGSLSKAAVALNLSYKKAWHLVDSINRSAAQPVTVKSTGGKDGGGTIVTAYGKSIIAAFDLIKKNCWEFLDHQLQQVEEL